MSTSLEQQWKVRVEEYATSGLSKTAYCRMHGIPYHQFHYWMKKLQSPSSNAMSTVQWLPLNLSTHEKEVSSSAPLCLQIGNVTIEVVEGFNETLLQRVVKVLTRDDQ